MEIKDKHKLFSSKNLYGILAVIIVIIPELFAEIAISLKSSISQTKFDINQETWRKEPELFLYSMKMSGLRKIARELKIYGYSTDNRNELTTRILNKIKNHRTTKMLKYIDQWKAL